MNIMVKVVKSNRKTVSIEITKEAEVIVRAPFRMPDTEIQKFLNEKSDWIEKHIQMQRARIENAKNTQQLTEEEIRKLAEKALEVIPKRVAHYAKQMGVTYGRITIRNQKTRWGSCSSKGNLNFNCMLMLLPPEIQDYVVVHELCHRKEMNHSPRFWAEVEKVLPDYQTRRKWLKENGRL